MRKLKMSVLISLLLWGAAPFAKADDGERAYRSVADHYYSFLKSQDKKKYHSNWESLAGEFRAVAESYPDSHKADDAWYMVGKLSMDCYSVSGSRADLEDALAAFGTLVEKYPESTLADDAQYLRGQAFIKLGQPDAAKAEYEKVITIFRRGDMARNAHERIAEIEAGKYDHLKKYPPEGDEKVTAAKAVSASETAATEEIKNKPAVQAVVEVEAESPAEAEIGSSDVGLIHHLRYYSGPEYTRVVVDLASDVEFLPPHLLKSDPSLGTPPRLYVDFTGALLGEEIKSETRRVDTFYELPISDGLLLRARMGQYQQDVVRMVLDIESIGRYQYFTLPGESGNKRYVMDVFGISKQRTPATAVETPQKPESPKGPVSLSPSPKKSEQEIKKQVVIMIDPGHGGKDPGAVGPRGLKEKDIVLRISLMLKRELEKEVPGAKVLLTRSRDEYLTLVERTAKANAANADLFLSVHCNASPNSKAYGMETYYLDNTTDRAALKLAARENFVTEEIMVDAGDYTNQILADLTNNSKVEESIPLAWNIQKSMTSELSRRFGTIRDLGVKKAPFWVLTGATMPCVLIETSFISNDREEKRLRSDTYQQALAQAIAKGTRAYLNEHPPLSIAAN